MKATVMQTVALTVTTTTTETNSMMTITMVHHAVMETTTGMNPAIFPMIIMAETGLITEDRCGKTMITGAHRGMNRIMAGEVLTGAATMTIARREAGMAQAALPEIIRADMIMIMVTMADTLQEDIQETMSTLQEAEGRRIILEEEETMNTILRVEDLQTAMKGIMKTSDAAVSVMEITEQALMKKAEE
jgi:hypothetical protein